MLVDANVLWRISDVETAVRMSAETMSATGAAKASQTIKKLQNDVLKQAEASLAYFVGTINFSDSMAAAAMNQRSKETSPVIAVAKAECATPLAQNDTSDAIQTDSSIEFNLYNSEKLDDAVSQ